MSLAKQFSEQIDLDFAQDPIRPDHIKKAFEDRLDQFGFDNVVVEDVEIHVEGILVDFADYDGDAITTIFVYDEEEGSQVIVINDDDADAEDELISDLGDVVMVDIAGYNPPLIENTPYGKLINLVDLTWMNKSALHAILAPGEIGPDSISKTAKAGIKNPFVQVTYDAYGNKEYQEVGAELSNEDLTILGFLEDYDPSNIDELMRTVVRAGKKVRLPVIRRRKKRRLTAKQRAGAKKGARKRKAKKSQINRARKKSLKVRKRLKL